MRTLTANDLEQIIVNAMTAGDWTTADDLAPRLDQTTPCKPTPPTVNAALYYATIGLHVFPLQPQSKIPYRHTRGLHDATTNPDRIVDWWQRWPDSNVAIATGHVVDVIDIDGPTGVASWAKLEHLPPILGTVSTPQHGGTHLYVAAAGDGNAAGIFPGIDYRGRGGYAVAPPSYVVERKKGYEGPYRWRRPLHLATGVSHAA